MSERKISDEMRKWCADLDSDDILCTTATLYTLADRIDREMVELPKDAEGVPIRVGDTLYNGGKKYVVTCIFTDYCDHSFAFYANNNESVAYNPEAFTHTRHDSWERIADELEEMVDAASHADDTCERLADLAERIRKLAKED